MRFKIYIAIICLAMITMTSFSCGTSRKADDGSSDEEAARQKELDEIEALLGVTPSESKSERDKQKKTEKPKKDDDMLGLLSSTETPVEDNAANTSAQNAVATGKEVKNLKAQLAQKNNLIKDLKAQIRKQSDQIYELETQKQSQRAMPASSYTATGGDIASSEYEQSYQDALSLFHARDYKGAVQMFENLLASDAGNSLSDNAQFWIGEADYAQRQYRKAIIDFEKVFTFPRSNKNDAAQFKLGLCYLRLGEKDKAREEFQRLIDVYPKSDFTSRAREHISSL